MGDRHLDVLPRSFYDRPVLEVARDLLGRVVTHNGVAVRLTEVEAYAGGHDPASHAFRGRTRRNAVMFGPGGHLYVYFTYGMHFCMNVVCGPDGHAAAVLLRAGVVIDGLDVARARRGAVGDRDLARGPARLTRALAVDRALDGADVADPGSPLRLGPGRPVADRDVRWGPRVGVNAAHELPWRAWVADEPSVSPYRAHRPKGRTGTSTA